MKLFLHLLSHFLLSLASAYLGKAYFNLPLTVSLIAALTGGFIIDLDHLLDYYLAFGLDFNLKYFLQGYAFLKSEKIYVILHSYELVFVCFLLHLFFRLSALFIFASSLLLHLFFDLFINRSPLKIYCLVFRLKHRFYLKSLVYPDHYEKFREENKKVKLILNT